jgi:hypothetical protein
VFWEYDFSLQTSFSLAGRFHWIHDGVRDAPPAGWLYILLICSIFYSQAPPDLGIIAYSLAWGRVLLLLALLF